MKIGVCSSFENWKKVADAGYDYIEGTLFEIASAEEKDFEKMRETLDTLPITVEATNGFFPYDITLYSFDSDGKEDKVGFEAKKKEIYDYAEKALDRAEKLGVSVSVLGSSRSRSIPDGVDPEAAEKQFIEILRICGEAGQRHGITVCVEPLCYKETNFVNTFADGYAIAKKAESPNVLAMMDFYHHFVNGEPEDTFVSAGKDLIHLHIAAGEERIAPTKNDMEYFTPFMKMLKDMNYNGRLSLECAHNPDFSTSISNALPIMRALADITK